MVGLSIQYIRITISEPNDNKTKGIVLKLLEVLERTARRAAPGRAPYFMVVHLAKSLMIVEAQGTIGRVKLARMLGLGEGSARTLIRHLEHAGLIQVTKAGIAMTNTGAKLYSDLKRGISEATEIPKSTLTVGPFNVAILVRNAADVIRGGVEQRDAAIKVGALGATTLIFNRGRLNMPLVNENVFNDIPAVHEALVSKLKPQENDIIVIGSASDKLTAEFGAIAAALETLKAHKLEA